MSFELWGGTNGVPYDLYGVEELVSENVTNWFWKWLGVGYSCNSYSFANQPVSQSFYFIAPPPPKLVPGLKMWLKANAGVFTNNNTARVSPWVDQSGNGNNALQGTDNLRPLFSVAALNGHPAIWFPGTNYFTLPNNLFNGVSEGEAFVVLQAAADPPATTRRLWLIGSGDGNYPNTDGRIGESFGRNGPQNTGDPVQDLTQPHLYNVVSRPGEFTTRINGVIHFSENGNVPHFSTTSLMLGRGASGYNFAGHIAEVLIYDRTLTSWERFAIHAYLSQRYGLTGSIPATPASLSAFAVSTNQISLTWSGPVANSPMSYLLQRRIEGGSFSNVGFLENAGSYLDSGLEANTAYTYRLKALNHAGESLYTPEATVTTLSVGISLPLDALKVWLKADCGVSGNPVNCWVDQTRSNWSAYHPVSTGLLRPLWVADGMNSRPAVYFPGTNAFNLPTFHTGWGAGEAYVVVRSLGPTVSQNVGLWLMGANGHASYYPSSDGEIRDNFGRSIAAPDAGTALSDFLSQAHLYNVLSSPNTWANWLNNAPLYATDINTVGFFPQPRLGWGAGTDYFRGYIAELLIFNRALSDAERQAVSVQYLRQRFGLW